MEETTDKSWYVVHTYSGYEERTQSNLNHRIESMDVGDKIFQVIVPTEDEIEIKGGERRTVSRKTLPGYILIQMKLDEQSWYVVRNTPGVTGFVASGNRPVPLEEEEVQNMLTRMESAAPKVRLGFSEGENVRIMDGPFAEFIGTVDEINLEKGKVRLMVSFFGRETPIDLDLSQVERI
jgi:transcription termination/antitermination protein NusG